ncbi:cytochrome-c peroxidase [Desulfopila sp. IMCC35008]|uniref:cytochrome-c peroxidase n=1 Tax=Desulfopila sp. IMCC35008 TaxID=2653858 RepID=UPI0013D63625|nr:cytochrome c peroxidase [Desulfopila sp. IMCC35008]
MKSYVLTGVLLVPILCISQNSLGAALSQEEQLGKIMYQDQDFSFNSTQSCQTCHHRTAGFADPTNARDPENTVVSTGANGFSLGGRNAPSAAYAGYSPPLEYDSTSGEWRGGLFWDGNADGRRLGDPLAEQAQGPPLNPVEMNMPDKESVVNVVRNSDYLALFYEVNGPGSLEDVDAAFDTIARNIATYERSRDLVRFSSRYDQDRLNGRERNGERLYLEKCSSCHVQDEIPGKGPLFTNYGYSNIGIPPNWLIYPGEDDLGLGVTVGESAQNGKFKVPTLRNVELSAPYGHNGYFPTLRDIVSFKNSRDSGNWPEPEVPENLSEDIGSLGLTESEIDDLVAFLMALTDQ